MKHLIDRVYRNVHLENITWIIENAPYALVELVESGKAKPCKLCFRGEENSKRMIIQSFSPKTVFRKRIAKIEESSSTSVLKSFDIE